MGELRKFIIDGKKSVARITSYIDYNEVDIPVKYDLEQMYEFYIWLTGFVDCLEKNNLITERS